MTSATRLAIWFALLLATSGSVSSPVYAADEPSAYPSETALVRDGFGKISVYIPGPAPKGLVLLLAGDDGWDARMQEVAGSIAELNYVVAGIGSTALQTQDAVSTSGENALLVKIAGLSEFLNERYHIAAQHPIIAGYGSGAIVVYKALALAPANVFHAGISLDFCRPQAGANDSPALAPAKQLNTTWFVFQSTPACDVDAAADFVRSVGNARLDSLEPVSEPAATPQERWQNLIALLQWLDPGIVDQLQATEKVPGVPLIELPAMQGMTDRRMAVFLSGDGGWAELDRTVSGELVKQGISVVGWDSLRYFWQARTPEEASRDLDLVLRHYLKIWNPDHIFLIGYSFGANVLPFMANRLAADLRERIKIVVLISPEPRASFEFHLSEWAGEISSEALPLLPEMDQIRWSQALCIYGDDEQSSPCDSFAGQGVFVLKLPGDHHYDGDYHSLAAHIFQFAERALGQSGAGSPQSH